jgi:hypothetical protein
MTTYTQTTPPTIQPTSQQSALHNNHQTSIAAPVNSLASMGFLGKLDNCM